MDTPDKLFINEDKNQIINENNNIDNPQYPSQEQIYTRNPNEIENINEQSQPLIEDYDAPLPQKDNNTKNIIDINFALSDSEFNKIPHQNIYKIGNNTLHISTGLLHNNIIGLIFLL